MTIERYRDLLQALAAMERDPRAEDYVDALDGLAIMAEALRDLRARFREAGTAFLESVGGELVVGEVRHYLGTTTRYSLLTHGSEPEHVTKAKARVIESLLNATAGDMDAVAKCLSSDPFAPGRVRTTLQESVGDEVGSSVFDRLYEKVVAKDPKTGKSKRQPTSMPTAFGRKGAS